VDGSSIVSVDAGTQALLYDQFWDHNLVMNPMVSKILSWSKHCFNNTGTGLGTLM